MSNKFESLLELLINEENDKAEALFHEIEVEKSRDIYENLADGEVKAEAKETEAKDEAKEDDKKEEVKETEKSNEKKDEKEVDETKEDKSAEEKIKDEGVFTKPAPIPQAPVEKTDEESIEEIGGDPTDELIKDISSDEEGEGDVAADELGQDMDADAENGEEGSVEDRVVDLEDALDELKAEFEAMMADKNGDDDEEAEETAMAPVIPAQETQPEVSRFEAKAKEDKKDVVKEYKIKKSADNADHADSKGSPIAKTGGAKQGGTPVKTGSGAEDKGRPAPTAEKVKGEFANSPGKDKSTSYKKEVKADTKDGSDKSGKSVISGK